MGEILAFSPRPPASDWSASERGLLTLLTQQLAASYGAVDGVFGQTDSGDPWYVVTDANQEVLVHIARIDGQFVVHDAAVDMFHQVGTLWGALRHVMAIGTEEQGGVVVAFNPSSREAQSFLSLVIAVGLYLEMRGVDLGEAGRLNFGDLPRADDPSIESVAGKLIAALDFEAQRALGHGGVHGGAHVSDAAGGTITAEGGQAISVEAPQAGLPGLLGFHVALPDQAGAPSSGRGKAAASSDGGESAGPPVTPPPSATDLGGQGFTATKYVMVGTSGNDRMIGTPGGDTIHGGAGDDYIDSRGAIAGEVDRVDGGAGNDKIVMSARVVASGGTGSDTFLISAAQPADKAETLLGVVLDFSAGNGDHLAVQGMGQVTVVSATVVGDVLAVQSATLGEALSAQVTDVNKAVAGARVGFDVNGDGKEDVFILLGGAETTTFKLGATIINDPDDGTTTVTLVGQSSANSGHPADNAPPV